MSLAFAPWLPDRDYRVIQFPDRDEALLFVTGNHRLLRISRRLAIRLQQSLLLLERDEKLEWNRLAALGILSDVNAACLDASPPAEGARLAINVNLTSFCNLGCIYCFADGGDYGRIRGRLDTPTVDGLFQFIEEQELPPGVTVRFEFFGGEPMLNFERIEEVCRKAEDYEEHHGVRFIHRISTNLTLIPTGLLELFDRKQFTVSVAIDGGPETHNRNRPNKLGGGSYERIIKNCETVRAVSDNITIVARMTVLGGKPSILDNVLHLWSLNLFDYFQIYPGVVPSGKSEVFQKPTKSEQGGASFATMSPDFLIQLSELMAYYPRLFDPRNRFKGALEYERIVEMVTEGKMALSFCSGGRNYFTFSPDDSIMPCHRVVGEIKFKVGESRLGLQPENAEIGLSAWCRSIADNPVCSRCWLRYICGGGCKQENFIATGDLNTPSDEGCTYQTQLVENVLAMMMERDVKYRHRDRSSLQDLFVSCGRPIVRNHRQEPAVPELAAFRHLHPVF